MFSIIEFGEDCGGELAIVRSEWCTPRKKHVFWPPHREQSKFNKVLRKGEEVLNDTWTIYPIQRIFYETDDFDDAQKKIKAAEVTSDLQTESDCGYSRKRRIINRKRLYESESDEESKLPRPPKVKLSLRDLGDSSVRHSTPSPVETDSVAYSAPSLGTNDPEIHLTSSRSRQSIEGFPSSGGYLAANPAKVARFLAQIKEQNSQIIEQSKIILNILKERSNSYATLNPKDLPVELPIANENNLEIIEEFLKNSSNFKSFLNYLSKIGGKDVPSKTNRVLKEILTDTVAEKYNFYGKRSKKPFSELQLRKAIVGAIKLNDVSSTDKEIEDAIKIWLKHAPERNKQKRQKRREKRTEIEQH